MTLSLLLAALAVLSLVLLLWQCAVAARFPLHRRTVKPERLRSVSLLKPLKGCDAETESCLRSWLTQDYDGPVEILFGVADPADPVCALVTRLIEAHPRCDARLILCSKQLGPNAKVSSLVHLAREAKHDLLGISDADVWAPADFLAQALGAFRDPDLGLVNAFYRFANPLNVAMRWEAFAINADFWSQVLQSVSLKPMDFALGAAMFTTRRHLDGIGGFSSIVDYLADDYELGHRIAANGGRIELSPIVVECRERRMTFGEVWAHQLRWARTIRVCQPLAYFFSILSNATLWPLLWLSWTPSSYSMAGAGACLAIRMLCGTWLERRLNRRWHWDSGLMALLKDLVQLPIWALAFTGSDVLWRGTKLRVTDGGRLRPAS